MIEKSDQIKSAVNAVCAFLGISISDETAELIGLVVFFGSLCVTSVLIAHSAVLWIRRKLVVLCHKFSRREPSSLHRSRAAWAARQARDDADVETAPHRRDRIGNVPLRAERRRLWVDNFREWKVLG